MSLNPAAPGEAGVTLMREHTNCHGFAARRRGGMAFLGTLSLPCPDGSTSSANGVPSSGKVDERSADTRGVLSHVKQGASFLFD